MKAPRNFNPRVMATLMVLIVFLFSYSPRFSLNAAPAPQSRDEIHVDHTIGKDKLSVVPDKMLRGYDPVTVFFPSDRGPAKGGPADQPGGLMSFQPDHPGEYRWLDARTLQFLPAEPWPALTRYKLSVSGSEFQLVTLMAPPVALSPADEASGLEPVKEIILDFAHRMDPVDLSAMLTFEIRPLPGVGGDTVQWLGARDFSVRERERTDIGGSVRYIINLHKAVDYGKRINLHLRLSSDSAVPGALARYGFSTKALFRVVSVGNDQQVYPITADGSLYSLDQAMDCGEGAQGLTVRFSDTLGPVSLEQVKQMIRFSPAVRNLSCEVSGDMLLLHFETVRDKPCRADIRYLPLKNSAGRVLTPFGDSSLWFFHRTAAPYLRWLAANGVLEQYGPQVFPMEGRNMAQMDLRIYKINPLNLNFQYFPATPVEIDENQRPAGPGEEPSYGENLQEQIKLLGSPLVSRIVPLPIKSGTGKRFAIDLREHLAKISGPAQPGTYLVGFRPIGVSATRFYVRVQVTDLSLNTVEEENAVSFVVASLKSGAPTSGASVALQGFDNQAGKYYDALRGVTGANGIFRYVHTAPLNKSFSRIVVQKGDDVLTLNVDAPPPYFNDNHWYNSYSSWLQWLNEKPRAEKTAARPLAFILTERPVYRPEEEVHIKGYYRLRQSGQLRVDNLSGEYHVVIEGPGQKRWTYPVQLNAYGAFYLRWQEKDLPTGKYYARFQSVVSGGELASVDFKKEAYRIPRFEVTLNSPERTALDEAFTVALSASYYAGGLVANQEINWRVTRFPFAWSVPGYEDFLFSTDKRFSGENEPDSKTVLTRNDVTDDNGGARIEIDPTLDSDAFSRRYVVEATVRGADEQTVTATRAITTVSPFALGLKLERFIPSGAEIKPQVIIIDHTARPLAGKAFHLKLLQRQWRSHLQESDFTTGDAKYVTDVVDVVIHEAVYQSGNTPLPVVLPVKEAGVYLVEISAADKQGRLQKVQADCYLAGPTPVNWKKPKANVFETVTDKAAYNPGDTAAIILKSPFQEAQALAVVEGPKENSYAWVAVTNGQGVFRLPVTGDMHPAVFVHFLLMRGRLPETGKAAVAGREDRGKPISMASSIRVNVNPRDNQLELRLDHPEKTLPGKKMKITIKLSDPSGKPLDGEVALWLVDRAVLALGVEKRLDPLPSFIVEPTQWLRIRETRNSVVGNIAPEDLPGGDVGEEEGGSIFDRVTVRKNFKTVPYYNSGIEVKNGLATVEVEIPDNLTDFAVRAIACDRGGRFGFCKSMISVRLPVIVQAALPRFIRSGDVFVGGGIGRIVEGEGGPGQGEIKVAGLTLRGSPVTPVAWVPGQPVKVFFSLQAPDVVTQASREATVQIAVRRNADGAADAFLLPLPIYPDQRTRRLEKFISLKTGGAFTLPKPNVPVRPGSMTQTFLLTTEPVLVKILAGLDYLDRYPHGCLEQRLSKIIPELILRDTIKKIGREGQGRDTDRRVRETLIFMESCQKSSGLFSYWPGSNGYVTVTAYAAEFLLLAKKLNYPVKPEMLNRTLSVLKEALRSDYRNFIPGSDFTERAEALYALALAGQFDPSYSHELMTRGMNMDLYSEARILSAILMQPNPDGKAAESLRKDLENSMVITLEDGKEAYKGLKNRGDYRTGLIHSGEAQTLAAVIRALYKAEPKNRRIRMLVNSLIGMCGEEGWGDTSASSAALLALADVLESDAPEAGSCDVSIRFGAELKKLSTGKQRVVKLVYSGDAVGVLEVESAPVAPDGQLPLLWASAEYTPAAPGWQAKAENAGFVISRETLLFKDLQAPPEKYPVAAGQTLTLDMAAIVEEHIEVINPEKRFFVAIDVPFAAGYEPMNPSLATAPPEATPSGQFTRQPDYAIYGDDRVTFYFDILEPGACHFYFRLRASVAGTYVHPPAAAELMYRMPVRGYSDGARVTINPRRDIEENRKK